MTVSSVSEDPAGGAGRAEALRWAESLREVRAKTCSDLAAGRSTLRDVLEHRHDPTVGCIHLLCVLEALPGARKVDTRRALADEALPERVRIDLLDGSQVTRVLARFAGDAGG